MQEENCSMQEEIEQMQEENCSMQEEIEQIQGEIDPN
jgi:hypothetical protein